jgi:hypothetical protein
MSERQTIVGRLWVATVAAAILTITFGGGGPAAQLVAAPPTGGRGVVPVDQYETVGIDVTIERAIVDNDGKEIATPVPRMVYRWERSQRSGRWKTIVTLVSTEKPTVLSPTGKALTIDNPFAVARFEDDDESGPRFFNARGEPVMLPGSSSKRRTQGRPASGLPEVLTALPDSAAGARERRPVPDARSWISAMIAARGEERTRQDDLARRYGSPKGKVRGLSQFLRSDAGNIEEVLFDDAAGVPVEMNVVRDGELQMHATYGYAPLGSSGDLVREHVTTEHRLPDGSGHRGVVHLGFSNLRMDRRR